MGGIDKRGGDGEAEQSGSAFERGEFLPGVLDEDALRFDFARFHLRG
jgi:hypothetical protein